MTRDPAIVAGAGIGGLTAAIALKQAGYDVHVFERSDQLREVGAGVTLWSNAMTALDRIGVAEQVRQVGSRIDHAELWSWRGDLMSYTPVKEIGEQLGMPSYGIHRASLQRLLYQRCAGIEVHLGRRC
ncbi:MAG: FAD-dependent monooxygenase, partial [Holophagales bacterium]|nr:FAD-dependent monooxygenase [Holophagales bacterium]